jgi:cysteine desulfurase / selenocysteine lyase
VSGLTLERLLGDEPTRQREFPICRRIAYLAHAAVGPLPRRVVKAVTAYLQRASEKPQDFDGVMAEMEEVRKSAARLISAETGETALLGPTSLGLSMFALGLDWRSGDEVVCYRDDYPATIYPLLELRRRGVDVVYVEPETPGMITPEIVAAALTKRTRLVALASCNFVTGFRLDLAAIGRMLRERGILFAVDGIQSVGAFPLVAPEVDFMSADSHKWLLGPETAGIVFVKKERLEELRPILLGGSNAAAPNNIAQDEIRFLPGARRYEPGALNFPGLAGMKAAIDLQLELGPDAIADHLGRLKRMAVERLQSLGCILLRPTEGANVSSITTFSRPGADSAKLVGALEKEGVIVSLRFDRAGKNYVRISPHFYNTFEEMERMIGILERALTDR